MLSAAAFFFCYRLYQQYFGIFAEETVPSVASAQKKRPGPNNNNHRRRRIKKKLNWMPYLGNHGFTKKFCSVVRWNIFFFLSYFYFNFLAEMKVANKKQRMKNGMGNKKRTAKGKPRISEAKTVRFD